MPSAVDAAAGSGGAIAGAASIGKCGQVRSEKYKAENEEMILFECIRACHFKCLL